MGSIKAFRIFNEDGLVVGRPVEVELNELDPGNVVIRTAYSSVNYKDALAATGSGKIIRRFPCIGGIDLSGVVLSSTDPRFKEADSVLVTGYDLGVAHDGGYSECVRVPGDWVVPLPEGLSLFEAMALGTAGYTAALSIHILEQNGLNPRNGKVAVTGATGGVSSLGIDMLAKLGYRITAITRKKAEQDYLKELGAEEILLSDQVGKEGRPLEKPIWAGAMDSVGGETLAWLIRTMQPWGAIASYGNAGGVELNTTVFPFILRGVCLLGIDSANTPMPLRRAIWQRLGGDLKPRHIDRIAHTVGLSQLPEVFDRMLKGQTRGRVVVAFD